MEHLTFRLYGPMASWGEIAVGESRHTDYYPSKSAIIGLLGAALGLRREEEEAHQNLANAYLQATKVLRSGQLLKDYHTAQAPDSAGKFRYRTRRDEIVKGRDRLGTVLSSREFLSDSHAVVSIRPGSKANWSLSELAEALTKPKFHLYLGRKAFPLAAPLSPQTGDFPDFRNALDSYELAPLVHAALDNPPAWMTDERWLPAQEVVRYYWEGEPQDFSSDTLSFPFDQVQRIPRYDKPASRLRWQFQPRTEYCWLHESQNSWEAS